MAFPGTYDINYYRGDTFEFRIYPRDNSGEPFSLQGYLPPYFTIADVKGPAATVSLTGYAEIVANEYIKCAITPEIGNQLIAGTQYVYDVEIAKPNSPYNYIYTLLNGRLSVAEQVTSKAILSAPVAISDIVFSQIPNGFAGVWSNPDIGDAPTAYTVSLSPLPNFLPSATFTFTQQAVAGVLANQAAAVSSPAFPLVPGTTYYVKIVGTNAAGSSAEYIESYLYPEVTP
jgi:hypothetical protein